ncbi:MAG: ATP-dependent zinc metalloprotease FtsH [Desulfurivibrionaceae bacterium]|jgi:cell division protease FtsH|nr:ATP-dependent zinc metalloprotease FtsH [Pseudomonadota bacterium]MBU4407984.1 ATP-dependent zinc metalloprotease FtsH [Pseudomonadota bacterium]MBU4412752.1 ATP-dependent zinc metalloprotease FtsH [Pseudomonadota bacterium]MCG2824643.1 ATP-dependent zinc metalloprotease FtsH [Desulfobulbaceae bacterium]MDP2003565.1 ATP-dependent zinc metalloprotease FtsH [Desulfurivibrionaceae bacterium]
MTKLVYTLFLLAVLGIIGFATALFWKLENTRPPLKYNDFLTSLENSEIAEVHLKGGNISLTDIYGREFSTFSPDVDALMGKLVHKKVSIITEDDRPSPFGNLLTVTLPISIILIGGLLVMRSQQRKSEEEPEFAKNKAIHFDKNNKPITFDDVAGIPEAKEELKEIVNFLKEPKKFSRLGASLPKGVLLQGLPGTGKTLLAKAIAGEAGVPFYSFSGSDFVEMFVGVGASRVRDLFREAKKNAPCIVFIDEIDAVGAHRSGAGSVSGQDERGQTLNALLVEMDGFSRDDTIIVLAATNRPDILDPALRRPGRFDRQITILPPDVKGRQKIIEVHSKRLIISENVDLAEVARNTPGFTGAELANLVNEAALIAARENKEAIEADDFNEAKDRILIGIERKGFVISKDDRRTMAYHEAGHAIVARHHPEADPIQKISIIPRGRAMGHTLQQSLIDRQAHTREYLQTRIAILMGGRAAEKIGLNQQTTGAEDDLLRATQIATKMVCQWGMNEVIGPLAYAKSEDGFLGDQANPLIYSEITARHIDMEVRKLVEECSQKAHAILLQEKPFLRHLAETLLQTETLDREEMEIIFECSRNKQSAETTESSEGKIHECMTCPATSHCAHLPSPAGKP